MSSRNWKRGVTAKEVAAKVGADPSEANRLFRRVTGKTIGHYVMEKRKEYILTKIRERKCYAYELAQELGYREEHSFTRWVKRTFNMSWTELCEQHRNSILPPLARAALHLYKVSKTFASKPVQK